MTIHDLRLITEMVNQHLGSEKITLKDFRLFFEEERTPKRICAFLQFGLQEMPASCRWEMEISSDLDEEKKQIVLEKAEDEVTLQAITHLLSKLIKDKSTNN